MKTKKAKKIVEDSYPDTSPSCKVLPY